MLDHSIIEGLQAMLTLLSSIILRALHERSDFPDHPKDHADRYIRSPRARRHDGVSRREPVPKARLW